MEGNVAHCPIPRNLCAYLVIARSVELQLNLELPVKASSAPLHCHCTHNSPHQMIITERVIASSSRQVRVRATMPMASAEILAIRERQPRSVSLNETLKTDEIQESICARTGHKECALSKIAES
jgi:hypothetical protein